jgi:hypothetical protein
VTCVQLDYLLDEKNDYLPDELEEEEEEEEGGEVMMEASNAWNSLSVKS